MTKAHTFLCDIDRTLVGPGGVEPLVAEAIAAHQAAGNYISAITGGPLAFASETIHSLGISDPCALAGGAQIYDPSRGAIIEQRSMLPEDLNILHQQLAGLAAGRLVFNNFSREEHRSGGVRPDELPTDEPVYFANVTGLDWSTADKIVTGLQERGLQRTAITRAVASYDRSKAEVHFTDLLATKKYASLRIMELLGVSADCVTVMGDADNDLPMFEAVGQAGIKVAMGNATTQLKKVADMVIGDITIDPAAAGVYLCSRLPAGKRGLLPDLAT
jgi:HAD superfamily hydrolase (TIGR01484 family)